MQTRHTSGSIARLVGAELLGCADLPIARLDSLDRGEAGTLTFIRSHRFALQWAESGASAALVTRGVDVPGHDPSARALLVVADADAALARVLAEFAVPREEARPGVHPTAVVDATARLGRGVSVGPWCTIRAAVEVGDGAGIGAQSHIGRASKVGAGTVLHGRVHIDERCIIGRDCVLWPGVVIGTDGFGYLPPPAGAERREPVKVPHIGTVEIGDRVEIGANSCIDRAKFGATVVGDGTKIDNFVQIAHNCRVGRGCLLCGQVALAGSVTLEDGVVLAGSVAVADGYTVGAGAVIAGRSAVVCDIPPGETWWGFTAMPMRDARKNYMELRRLSDSIRELQRVKETLRKRGLLDDDAARAKP